MAGASSKADLMVKKLSGPPVSVAPGGTFQAKVTVLNAGKAPARKTNLRFSLSRDGKLDTADMALKTAKLKALARGKRVKVTTLLALPAVTPAGGYRLLACADPKRRVKESKERNNCRASKDLVTVTGAAGGPGPGGPGPGGPGPGGPGPGGPGPGDPGPGSGGPLSFPRVADPITVSSTLEPDQAQTKRVGSDGDTLSATAVNGTVYTLTIPAGALLGPTDVSLTPVESISGSGSEMSGGLIGAAEITPHGITLLQPATLVIEPPSEAPIADQTGFLFHENGEDFHLYPLGPERALTMRLTHFSTPGVGSATQADRDRILAHMPTRAPAQYEQAASELVRQEREAQLAGRPGNPNFDAAMRDLALAYYRDIVRPAMAPAETDDSKAETGIAVGLGWARQMQLFGMGSDPPLAAKIDEVFVSVTKILRNAVNKADERCRIDHKIDEIFRLLAFERTAQLTGLDLGQPLDKARGCARFELDFDSRYIDSRSGGSPGYPTQIDFNYHVGAQNIVLELDSAWNIVGEGPLRWLDFSGEATHRPNECGADLATTTAISAEDSTMHASLYLDLNPRQPGTKAPPPDMGAALGLDTGGPVETYERTWDKGVCAPETYLDKRWENSWGWGAPLETVLPFEGPERTVTGWERGTGTGDLLLRKTWTGSYVDSSDEGTLEVRHKPL